ncbi:Polyadenylate-binding protein [Vigna angularis]|uniref:Polyadenylate-binding protein n=1 Tax=Phaseolus angularis TaxID=3914 RepID=A0A8T0KLJ4_PHAAN|nr:Polyadenylate-binding protein [Vigna angularis]
MAQVPDNDSSEETNSRFHTTLYVGDLDETIDESQLFIIFDHVAKVVSVRICRDYATGKSLGYAYVTYSSRYNAAKAIKELNFVSVNGKTIRVTYSNRDPSVRKSGRANLYVKNLAPSIYHKALYDLCSSFGNILSCTVATDASGQSKGYGFVQFESEASAKEAIEKLNGTLLKDKKIYMGPFVSKQDRVNSDASFSNVYVKNLSDTITDAELQNIFGEYGDITSAVVMRHTDGRSKGFGFVNFANADNAARARDGLDGQTYHGKTWCVRRAQKKTERERELTEQYDQNRGIFSPRQGRNLYIKNLDNRIDDDTLKKIFCEFGIIISAKVMRDANGRSKGVGFVAYSSREAANQAIVLMHGRVVAGKRLYVAFAQKRAERRAMLEEELDYHLQNLPRLEMATGPPFSFLMPQRGPPRPRGHRPPGLGQPLVSHQQVLFRIPLVIALYFPFSTSDVDTCYCGFQTIPRGNFFQGPRRPNVQNSEMVPFNLGQPVPPQTLASAVANAPPVEQRNVLGEILFPLVQRLVHNAAPKVTGMLLELDQAEVLHMIQSANALEEKVAEAIAVLRRHAEERSNRR